MFTGIVEEKGTIRYIQLTGESGVLAVKAKKVLEGTKIGDSIAVNGICLTVTSLQSDGFTADVMAETIRRSSLGSSRAGSKVNLERAIAADGRFGGHIVSGHIDGTGVIRSTALWIRIESRLYFCRKYCFSSSERTITSSAKRAATFSPRRR